MEKVFAYCWILDNYRTMLPWLFWSLSDDHHRSSNHGSLGSASASHTAGYDLFRSRVATAWILSLPRCCTWVRAHSSLSSISPITRAPWSRACTCYRSARSWVSPSAHHGTWQLQAPYYSENSKIMIIIMVVWLRLWWYGWGGGFNDSTSETDYMKKIIFLRISRARFSLTRTSESRILAPDSCPEVVTNFRNKASF